MQRHIQQSRRTQLIDRSCDDWSLPFCRSSHNPVLPRVAVDERPRNLARFSLFVLLFSLFFWFWALINTVDDGTPDGGVVCFLGSTISSTYMLAIGNAKTMPTSKTSRLLATSSLVFVALIYVLGAYIHFSESKAIRGIYCASFFVLWLGLARCGHLLMNKSAPPQLGEAARLKERMENQLTPV